MRRIGRAVALVLLAGAGALAAQVARPQKARLALAPERLEARAGSEASLVAEVEIDPGWHVQAHLPTFDYLIPTALSLALPAGWEAPRVDYPPSVDYKFDFAEEKLAVYEGTLRLPVTVRVPAGAPPGILAVPVALRYQACDDRTCLPPVDASAELMLTVLAADGAPASAPPAAASPAPSRSLAGVLLLALAGGLILNAMPCVLPILSLKLFGLVKSSGASRAAVRAGALATAAGILVSFWALALAALAARGAGAAIGWGIQFQQPGFVAFLAVVVLLFSLNLWGLFEIPLPARLARLADAGPGEGLTGHFASGLFATLMATPCSAPFLGTALSFALGQTAGVIVATLTAVGAGLALPYLALAVAPGSVRLLPRPGPWMDTLRGAMGFLLAGAVVWLLYVLGAQVPAETVALFELALLALALAVWVAARAAAASPRRRFAWLAALLCGVAAIAAAATAPRAAARAAAVERRGESIAWREFDRAEAERLVASGRLVFLDITADWCVTCKVNERVVLQAPPVVEAFRRHAVVAMKWDWTNRNDEIARFLAEHDRYGIPFYLLWRPGQPPHVFGELISQAGVIGVLEAAAPPALSGN